MEEFSHYVFQVVCLLVFVAIVLSLCLVGCFKSLKSTRISEADIEATTNTNQVELNEEREVGNHRGHERALPEIPSTLMKMATSADDDDEDDSIYDIISRSKKVQPIISNQAISLPLSSIQINTITIKKQHPYEKVNGDGDSSLCGYPSRDPLYAGLKDITAGIVVDERSNTVKNISDPILPPSEIFYVGSDNTECLPQYSYVPNPVLPPRNFPEFILQTSSDSPNHFSSIDPIDSLAHRFIPSHQDTQWLNSFTGQQGNSTSTDQSNVIESTSDDRRVPNYSSVTARESLNNLRKRGQLCDNQEEMYDTINYDVIKGTQRQSTSTVLASDHVYCTTGSDLYAEIATGQSSSRSSIYAHVTDGFPQSNSNFSLTFQPGADCQIRTSYSSTSSIVQSFLNSDFPIYSVVNKYTRPKTHQGSAYGDNYLPATSSLKKSCAEMSQHISDTLQNIHQLESLKQDSEMKMKSKSEHSYSKIVFNKRNINHKSSLESNRCGKGKCKASFYDCVNDDSLYESVPIDLEQSFLKFQNDTKFKANEKIRIPWKDRCKKSNEDLRRDDTKKIRLSNGYLRDSDVFSHILSNGANDGLNMESNTDVFTSKNSFVAICSFPKLNKHTVSFEKNLLTKNISALGRSRFYVTNEILPEGNNFSSDCSDLNACSTSSSRAKNPPIREHIYELVKDATYIDDDGDDDVIMLESDV